MSDADKAAERRFEWDPEKNEANRVKHGLSFENAIRAFDRPMLRRTDDRLDYGEERWIALGQVDDVTIIVVYTLRRESVRIISARKANRNEKKIYEDAIRRQGSES